MIKVRGKEKPSSLKTSLLFTDRVEELSRILNEYDLVKANPGNASVIDIYGMAGIGKTTNHKK